MRELSTETVFPILMTSPKSGSRVTMCQRLQETGHKNRFFLWQSPCWARSSERNASTEPEAHQHWTVEQWRQVNFSNESEFCISFGNRCIRMWRKSGEEQKSDCLKSSVKFPRSAMWGSALLSENNRQCKCSSRDTGAFSQTNSWRYV